jgi:sigma-B regulation protein RsbU (phosphoserine phosphatase)
MAKLACYLAGLAIGLFALEKLLGLFAASWSTFLRGWVEFLAVVAAILFFVLGFKWVKRRILWRLRNRLIVTYVFIGVIPAVLLVTMAVITLYGLGGQFAVFVVTSEINSRLRSMEAANQAISSELAAHLVRGENPVSASLAGLRQRDSSWDRRSVCAWYGEKKLGLCDEFGGASIAYPSFIKDKFREIVRDNNQLLLRVGTCSQVGSSRLTVVTSEPFDKDFISKIANNLGEVTLFSPRISNDSRQPEKSPPGVHTPVLPGDEKNQNTIVIRRGPSNEATQQSLAAAFTAGNVPGAAGTFDREITFGTPVSVVDWKTGKSQSTGAFVQVTTRVAALYDRLFGTWGEFVLGVAYILLGLGIFLAIVELIALIIGTRMTRTVTAAVAQLYDATRHVDRGDFSHRIPVKSQDQLAQLSISFNSMTASIEKLIQEQKEKQRMENELAIAQEVQSQLFPRQISEIESLEVHGFCRPARTVSGDYYDFLTASSHKMILAVGDISGKGISAALLMATIHSAVRAYSVESLPQMREPLAVGAVAGAGRMMATWTEGFDISPSALLSLLNHQLYESTPPEKYATLFLGVYDGRLRRMTYSNGGHLPPIVISENGAITKLEAGGTVVGLFDNMCYDEGSVDMQPGDILVGYSDGVTEPENDFGEFGEQRLIDLVRRNRQQPLTQISQTVTHAVDDWIGDKEQPDDVTLVLARAR